MHLSIILVFSLMLFVLQVLVGSLLFFLLGVNADFEPVHYIFWFGLPFLASFLVFFILALRNLHKPYIHAFLVYALAGSLGYLSENLILEQSFSWQVLLVDFVLSALAIFLGMALGKAKHKGEQSTLKAPTK